LCYFTWLSYVKEPISGPCVPVTRVFAFIVKRFRVFRAPLIDDQEAPIGRVINIFETGANDVWVIKGSKEYLIPYIAEVVKEVDVENKKIIITPMEGLLD
ncbi:PRC-barrel domain-containing protein, partial [Staphylococcus aureus]